MKSKHLLKSALVPQVLDLNNNLLIICLIPILQYISAHITLYTFWCREIMIKHKIILISFSIQDGQKINIFLVEISTYSSLWNVIQKKLTVALGNQCQNVMLNVSKKFLS